MYITTGHIDILSTANLEERMYSTTGLIDWLIQFNIVFYSYIRQPWHHIDVSLEKGGGVVSEFNSLFGVSRQQGPYSPYKSSSLENTTLNQFAMNLTLN